MFGRKSENENKEVTNEMVNDQNATDYAEGMQAERESAGEKKPEAIEKEEVVEGAKKAAKDMKENGPDHCHILMGPKYKLNLLEVSHRDVEEIEKARFKIMSKHDGEKAVEEFKNFIFEKLLVK